MHDSDIFIEATLIEPIEVNRLYALIERGLSHLGFARTKREWFASMTLQGPELGVNRDVAMSGGELEVPANHWLEMWFEANPPVHPGDEAFGNMLKITFSVWCQSNYVNVVILKGDYPGGMWRYLDEEPYGSTYQKFVQVCDMVASFPEFASVEILRGADDNETHGLDSGLVVMHKAK